MGKKIDRFILGLVLATALYIYFYRAFENHMIALLLAILSCFVFRKILRKIFMLFGKTHWLQKKRFQRNAGSALMHLACIPTEEAHDIIADLLNKGYHNTDPIEIIQAHPATNLSQDKLFNVWKKHQGDDRLVICTTCKCDAGCKLMASSFKSPKLALVDAQLLGQLIAEYPEGVSFSAEHAKKSKLRLKHILSLFLNRRNAPRCLLFSASMLMMYIFSANKYYLVSALMLLFIALVSLRYACRPAKLF